MSILKDIKAEIVVAAKEAPRMYLDVLTFPLKVFEKVIHFFKN